MNAEMPSLINVIFQLGHASDSLCVHLHMNSFITTIVIILIIIGPKVDQLHYANLRRPLLINECIKYRMALP